MPLSEQIARILDEYDGGSGTAEYTILRIKCAIEEEERRIEIELEKQLVWYEK